MYTGKLVGSIMYVVFSHLCLAQSGPTPLALNITRPERCMKAGSHLEVRISLTNMSDHAVPYRVVTTGRSSSWARISVYDSAGKPVPDIASVHDGGVFSATADLDAAKSLEMKINLAKEYDLSKSGNYTVEVQPLYGERFKPDYVIVCISEGR